MDIRNGVAGFLFRKPGETYEVLLLRRAIEPFHGEWFPVEGKRAPHEQPQETMLREIAEETGLVPERLYWQSTEPQLVPSCGYWVRSWVFVGFVQGDAMVCLNGEHYEYRWLSVPEAVQCLPLPAQRNNLQRIAAQFLCQMPPQSLRVV